ncbi:MAG: SDR family oxidoreductase [Candidatus Marinimicrobia bacterium]|nr:SDR family oxidoreductase [Candidatus Neomarinimicrobiota bacterium]MCF7828751.1 SDR family oxidoreductase [Candidatus Neomarinimicrobiota bacterium]MCF7880668.1 SDR family oxidoreductase [Candidatus Neomarinimicrobiota bacterium]
MNLSGKIVIVTGGTGLLGKAMVSHISSAGAQVINFDVKKGDGKESETIICDVTSENHVQKKINGVLENYGSIHGLVNNAYPRTDDWGTDFEELSFDSWKKNVDWQLNSYAMVNQKVLPIMRNAGGGSIVNIASIYGIVGNDMTIYDGTEINPSAAYSAIKGGIVNLTRFLASKYGPYNVRINCVSPGGIFNNQPKKFVEAYEKRVPMTRMGKPEDIAPAVTFLLSDEAKYITGHNLVVDGGWTII